MQQWLPSRVMALEAFDWTSASEEKSGCGHAGNEILCPKTGSLVSARRCVDA